MKVALISTFPPDRGNLAEYGGYLARALAQTSHVSHVHVFANRAPNAPAFEYLNDKLSVHRLWTLDSVPSILRLVAHARALNPDVVHLNAGIRTWGPSRAANFAGASLPGLLRAAQQRVVTTMHTIGDTVKLDQFKEVGAVTKLGMEVAMRLYMRSHVVTVTLASMQRALEAHFGVRNVVHVPHGSYGARVPAPPPPSLKVLTFGFWGAFKDADLMVNAVEALRREGLPVELVLGGGAHPYHPEIYQTLRERNQHKPFVQMTGYVAEEKLGELFTQAAVVVLPYRTNAGASGVLNLARSYGRPVVTSAEPGLMEQVRSEGGASLVFSTPEALVDALRKVLTDHALQRAMGEASLDVARNLTLDSQAAKIAALYDPDAVPSVVAADDGVVADAIARAQGSKQALPWPHPLRTPPHANDTAA